MNDAGPETLAERVLAVDFGERRVGLAVSDPLGWTAQPLPTIHVRSMAEAVDQVAALARAQGAVTIVVGLPLHMSGERGARAARSERFARELELATGVRVVLWDERLTSAEASRYLREGGRRHHPREDVDRIAASLILAGYLERQKNTPPEPEA